MKLLLSYLLILSIAIHLFGELGIYVSFKLNQDYIAKYLCIEKDIPESTCHGCCQLKDRLEKHEEQKEKLPQTENKKYEIQFFVPSAGLSLKRQNQTQEILYSPKACQGILLAVSIFHPPRNS